jgi:ABC-2 type transport system ATP-binding protein
MIAIRNVRKQFGRVTALDTISLSVQPGERVAFVGANGSGKTTLLRALLGLVRVDGSLTIDGRDVSRQPELALRNVAYIPQVAPPIEASVAELVAAHAALRQMDAATTYERAKLLGFDVAASSRARFRDLSGGMKQKLLAAMALATNASVLVCDEPTANLDGPARAAFFEQLSARSSTDIVVLCSHRIEEVQKVVQRVVEFAEGRIVRDAPTEDVLRGMRAFRVEVELHASATAVRAKLLARGFRPSFEQWLTADMGHVEKVEFVTHLLPEYRNAFVDLSIVPIDTMVRPPSHLRPRLKVVAS